MLEGHFGWYLHRGSNAEFCLGRLDEQRRGLVLREVGYFLSNKVRKQGENPKLL